MKFLVISSCFAPKNVIGAVRISKIVKYFVRAGHEVTVISPELEDYDVIDETLECPEFDHIRRVTVPYSKLTTRLTRINKRDVKRESKSEAGNINNTSIKAALYQTARNVFAKWRDIEWLQKVKAVIISEKRSYDIVFSSYPNVSTHDAARFVKNRDLAKIWIADFRDPIDLEREDKKKNGRAFKRQAEIVHDADMSVFVSKVGTEHFSCLEEDKNKLRCISNGFDPEDFQGITEEEEEVTHIPAVPVVFSYAGGMYKGERDCSPLFKAIKELINEKRISIGDVSLKYAGPDIGILRKQAEAYGLSSIIIDKGSISRSESLKMQKESDCVIVATDCYADYGGAMTGKIYEPIMMKKNILLLVNGNGRFSEPASFVRTLNAGIIYEKATNFEDVSQIKRFILESIEVKKNGKQVRSCINDVERERYKYESIVSVLLAEIMKCVS